ncbi:MAG: hypothetical protein ACK5IM_03355, partial [Demequina sp.]
PRRTGVAVGVVIGVIVGVVVLFALLAAIAIPLFLNQQQKAQESAARADAASIVTAATAVAVETMETPEVTFDDGTYLVGDAIAILTQIPASDGVSLVQFRSTATEMCAATAVDGSVVHFSSVSGAGDGPCP